MYVRVWSACIGTCIINIIRGRGGGRDVRMRTFRELVDVDVGSGASDARARARRRRNVFGTGEPSNRRTGNVPPGGRRGQVRRVVLLYTPTCARRTERGANTFAYLSSSRSSTPPSPPPNTCGLFRAKKKIFARIHNTR